MTTNSTELTPPVLNKEGFSLSYNFLVLTRWHCGEKAPLFFAWASGGKPPLLRDWAYEEHTSPTSFIMPSRHSDVLPVAFPSDGGLKKWSLGVQRWNAQQFNISHPPPSVLQTHSSWQLSRPKSAKILGQILTKELYTAVRPELACHEKTCIFDSRNRRKARPETPDPSLHEPPSNAADAHIDHPKLLCWHHPARSLHASVALNP